MVESTGEDHAAALSTAVGDVPVIDVSSLMTRQMNVAANTATTGATTYVHDAVLVDESIIEVAQQIHHAASQVGFFYISGHGIADELIRAAHNATVDFFALDPALKESVKVNRQQRGWMPVGMAQLEGATTHDLKEVFFYGPDTSLEDADVLAGKALSAVNRWPGDVCMQLQRRIVPYHRALCTLGSRLLSAIAVSFDQPPDSFKPYYQKPMARGQLVYYPNSAVSDEQSQRFGVAPHTDFGVLTLLHQDQSGGLQIKNRAGDWIEAPPIPGTLVCNTGDLLERWSNGRFKSTVHRVINRSGRARYSMPVFFDPDSDAVIDPALLGAVATGNPTLQTAGEHIAARNSRNFTQYTRD